MCAHWFYLVIIAATYTGVLGPFLISSAAGSVTGLNSLKEGSHTVVVRGPIWDDKADEPKFLGGNRGGTSDENTPRSTQFKILQNMMTAVIWQSRSFVTLFRLNSSAHKAAVFATLIVKSVAGLESKV